MAKSRFKLLLCLAILMVHIPLTWARQPESGEVVHRTQFGEGDKQTLEKGKGGESEDEEGKEGEGSDNAANVAVSFTLIGSFTFLISLMFAMNHPDPEMKEYAYTVISSTVSIFSAVLMFQSLNGLVETFILEKFVSHPWLEFLVDGLHMLVWYITMQLVIAKVCKAFKPDAWRDEQLAEKSRRHEIQKAVKVERICWGIIFAHLTGFASINFWSSLQSLGPFNQSWRWSLLPIPIAAVAQLLLQTVTDFFRECWASGDGKKDWFEEKWDESCEEAEDDILGLTMSVLIVGSCRYAINSAFGFKCLPNEEQKEEGTVCEDLDEYRTNGQHFSQIFLLYALGLCLVVALFITRLLFAWYLPEEEKMMEADEAEEEGDDKGKEVEKTGKKPTKLQERIKRFGEVWLVTLSMSFSWCIFHGTYQLLKAVRPGYLGKEANATTLHVVLALSVTWIAFLIIRLLDMLADLPDRYTPPAVDLAIRQCIKAMSLFIGFAWEQTFDESVDALADNFKTPFGEDTPAIAKLVIGAGCIGIVFLAWKKYILPVVVQQGWTVGYIEGRDALEDTLRFLMDSEKDTRDVYSKFLTDLENHKSAERQKHAERQRSTPSRTPETSRSFFNAQGYRELPGL